MPASRRSPLLCGGLLAALIALALVPAFAAAQLPDPMERGDYAVTTADPFLAGLVSLHEPNSSGGAPSGASSEITLQVRGTLTRPSNRVEPSPVLVFVHGNHGSCDSGGGSAPNCTIFKRNDSGYAYLAENLASWGYTVISLDQDQLMSRQDSAKGKGMHQRRLLIAAALDAFHAANEAPQPIDADNNLGDSLVGKLDFTRIGLMGHSRGGDAVSSFVDYNRIRPEPGRRYPLRGVISLAPVDYERKAPVETPYMTVLPWCDGDVSNLQGARMYERGQHVKADDPFPRIQSSQLGANHNWYNTVWFADGQDGGFGSDQACRDTQPNHSRLSGEAYEDAYVIDNSEKLNPLVNTRISGDPARMGDQEKIGLATMSAFFRRYVGGEGALDPYMTGELSEDGLPQIPATACPTSVSGMRMECIERVSNSYFAGAQERLDVIRPESDEPLGLSALGTRLTGSGFSNPYLDGGGVSPIPPTTEGGYDWCNPEPEHFAPSQLGVGGRPLAEKPCPLPADGALGGQGGTRENAPVNHSYGRQLALAWDDPAEDTGIPAKLTTRIPKADGDVSGMKALAMGADVNFFDARNPARSGTDAEWNPALTTQDFTIALADAAGHEGTVAAGDPRYGNALHQSTGSTTNRMHIVLDQIRVPLADFAAQGVDLESVRKLELRFGEDDMPQTGSIQLSDVRFQESAEGTDVLVDSTTPDAGPAVGPPASGPDPAAILESYDRAPASVKLPDVVGVEEGQPSVWTVDDDRAECPGARFTSIQDAVDHATPWDTIVVCDGLYQEASTPVHHASSPVQAGSMNGLTITKPLKIKGAGADKVTIEPAPSLAPSLAGTAPYLRDGGGNVITIARQSLGSTDDNEHFVDISGVTVTSPEITAEAGIAFLNASGRISDSVVGPLTRATDAAELAAAPHGWGVVSANSLIGIGAGTVQRQVTVDNSLVAGYQSGGILFDGSRGADGHADNAVRQGIKHDAWVTNSIVSGAGADSLIPQTGVRYHAGVRGFVQDSRITDNLYLPDPRASAGISLTDAATELSGWSATGNVISGNGYGLFNADITDSAVREGAPAMAIGNYWGNGTPPVEGPSAGGSEGISGDDAAAADSVTVAPSLGTPPETVPTAIAPVPDAAPVVEIREPLAADEVNIEVETAVIVRARDDFGVKSVELELGAESLGSDDKAPYEFTLDVPAAMLGTTQELTATATDSSGQADAETIEVEIVDRRTPPPLIRSIAGSRDVKPEVGFSLALVTSKKGGSGTAVYTLGSKVICTTSLPTYPCSYLPTGGDVGTKPLSVTLTDSFGQSSTLEKEARVRKFSAGAFDATAERQLDGTIELEGQVVMPARVSAAQGCHGDVLITHAANEFTVSIEPDCGFAYTLPPRPKDVIKLRFGNEVVQDINGQVPVVAAP